MCFCFRFFLCSSWSHDRGVDLRVAARCRARLVSAEQPHPRMLAVMTSWQLRLFLLFCCINTIWSELAGEFYPLSFFYNTFDSRSCSFRLFLVFCGLEISHKTLYFVPIKQFALSNVPSPKAERTSSARRYLFYFIQTWTLNQLTERMWMCRSLDDEY